MLHQHHRSGVGATCHVQHHVTTMTTHHRYPSKPRPIQVFLCCMATKHQYMKASVQYRQTIRDFKTYWTPVHPLALTLFLRAPTPAPLPHCLRAPMWVPMPKNHATVARNYRICDLFHPNRTSVVMNYCEAGLQVSRQITMQPHRRHARFLRFLRLVLLSLVPLLSVLSNLCLNFLTSSPM